MTDAELSIALVNDCTIRDLNRTWRNLDRATDVLSFSQREGEGPIASTAPTLLGDVVINIEAAERQARRLGHSLENELVRLLVHGILHLAGFDHVKGGAATTKMRREEARLVRLVKERRRGRAVGC